MPSLITRNAFLEKGISRLSHFVSISPTPHTHQPPDPPLVSVPVPYQNPVGHDNGHEVWGVGGWWVVWVRDMDTKWEMP